MQTSQQESGPTNPEITLSAWQWDSVFNIDHLRVAYIIGGRGSGKSYTDVPRVMRWSDMAKDMYFGIFANTESQLNTVTAPITQMLDELGIKHVYESQAPKKWRARWARQGIQVPARRLRNLKVWIWEDGTHIFTGTLLSNAYTRAKSLDFNAILVQEFTEPGVSEDAIDTLFACLRCGKAKKQEDGTVRCSEPGHLHQLVVSGNVPLNEPGHWVYRKVEKLEERETKRVELGARPFFRLITSRTQDNPATGEDYVEGLRAALDPDTFEQQTSGRLARNLNALSYHSFSDENILSTLRYDNARDLHLWFDNNATPSTAGWGQDLVGAEVPKAHLRAGLAYFGVVGELFSGAETMFTEQVARALLEDPSKDAAQRCRESECGHPMASHVESAKGMICRKCAFVRKDGTHCRAGVAEFEAPLSIVHALPGWRGLAKHRANIFVYGDASLSQTHASAGQKGGSLQILRDAFESALGERVHFRVPPANPKIGHRMLAVNRGLLSGARIRSIFFAPVCKAHIDDCREVVPDPKTGDPKKVAITPESLTKGARYGLRTHSMDGFGYMWAARFPFRPDTLRALPSGGEDTSLGPMETDWRSPIT